MSDTINHDRAQVGALGSREVVQPSSLTPVERRDIALRMRREWPDAAPMEMPEGFVDPDARVAPDALDLDAIEARARARVRLCEGAADGQCGAPCTKRCNAGGDCGIERCDAHAEDFSGACDHDWYPVDSGANDTLALVCVLRDARAELARVREESAARLVRANFIRDEIRAAAKSVDVPGGDEIATAKRMANCITKLRALVPGEHEKQENPVKRDPDPTVPGAPGERVTRLG